MRADEVDRRELQLGRADPLAQLRRRQSRKIEEALRTAVVGQNPRKNP
jgi:hypothetical protein